MSVRCPSCRAVTLETLDWCPRCGCPLSQPSTAAASFAGVANETTVASPSPDDTSVASATAPPQLVVTPPRLAGRVALLAFDGALLCVAMVLGVWLLTGGNQSPPRPTTPLLATSAATFAVQPQGTSVGAASAAPTARPKATHVSSGGGAAPPPTSTPTPMPRQTSTPTPTPTPTPTVQSNH